MVSFLFEQVIILSEIFYCKEALAFHLDSNQYYNSGVHSQGILMSSITYHIFSALLPWVLIISGHAENLQFSVDEFRNLLDESTSDSRFYFEYS